MCVCICVYVYIYSYIYIYTHMDTERARERERERDRETERASWRTERHLTSFGEELRFCYLVALVELRNWGQLHPLRARATARTWGRAFGSGGYKCSPFAPGEEEQEEEEEEEREREGRARRQRPPYSNEIVVPVLNCCGDPPGDGQQCA